MAGYPPPPPQGPGGPYGIDPRMQRRLLKQQAQMQKRMLVAQAAAYRQQTRALRSAPSSILGALLLIGLGVVFLLARLGVLPAGALYAWYGRWWPLLLVGAGLVLVLEWAFDRKGRPGVTGRGLGGGTVLLLILLALAGAAAQTFGSNRPLWGRDLHLDGENWAQFLGEKHERQVTLNEALPKGARVVVDNARGDVILAGTSPDDAVHVVAEEEIYSGTDEDLTSRTAALAPQITRDGANWKMRIASVEGGSSDLTITVPAWAATAITAAHGDIHVSETQAEVLVATERGDTEVDHVRGAVTAHTDSRRSTVQIHDVEGTVALKGVAGDVDVNEIQGGVAVDGDFYGDTHMQHVGGPVEFKTSRTSLSMAKLQGEVDISQGADLSGSGLIGPVNLKTYSRNISLDEVQNGVSVTNRKGSVSVTTLLPLGPVSIDDDDGEVTLTLPRGAGATVNAAAAGGEIESELPLPAPVSAGDTTTLRGTVGDGAAPVQVRTSHADISLNLSGPAAPSAAPSSGHGPVKTRSKDAGTVDF